MVVENTNIITGSDNAETLNGIEGNDSIEGKEGQNNFYGGYGNDEYIFGQDFGLDIIKDNYGNDIVKFSEGIIKEDLLFSKKDNDLFIEKLDLNESIIFKGFYASSSQVKKFLFSDGFELDSSALKNDSFEEEMLKAIKNIRIKFYDNSIFKVEELLDESKQNELLNKFSSEFDSQKNEYNKKTAEFSQSINNVIESAYDSLENYISVLKTETNSFNDANLNQSIEEIKIIVSEKQNFGIIKNSIEKLSNNLNNNLNNPNLPEDDYKKISNINIELTTYKELSNWVLKLNNSKTTQINGSLESFSQEATMYSSSYKGDLSKELNNNNRALEKTEQLLKYIHECDNLYEKIPGPIKDVIEKIPGMKKVTKVASEISNSFNQVKAYADWYFRCKDKGFVGGTLDWTKDWVKGKKDDFYSAVNDAAKSLFDKLPKPLVDKILDPLFDVLFKWSDKYVDKAIDKAFDETESAWKNFDDTFDTGKMGSFYDWKKSQYEVIYWWDKDYKNAERTFPATKSDPLVFDLDGYGVETTDVENGIYFDLNNDGFAEKTAWIGSNEGFLAYDRNKNGIIDSGKELFGDFTIIKSGNYASNGFAALAELDTNADSKIDSKDSEFSNLKILTGALEIRNLNELGIQSINLDYTNVNETDGNNNTKAKKSTFSWDSYEKGEILELNFDSKPVDSIAREWLNVPDHILPLPDLAGSGTVYNLHQAIVRDKDGIIVQILENFINEGVIEERYKLVDQLLINWSKNENINENLTRGSYNARKLAILESFSGKFFRNDKNSAVNPEAGVLLDSAYSNLREIVYVKLLAQSHLKEYYDKIDFYYDKKTNSVKGDISFAITELKDEIAQDPMNGKLRLGEFTRILKRNNLTKLVNYDEYYNTFVEMGEEYKWFIDSLDKVIIEFTEEDDYIDGSSKSEAILAKSGNDTIYSRQGDDFIQAGGGDDYIDSCYDNDIIFAEAGNDTIIAGNENDTLYGGIGNDSLEGGKGNDTYEFRKGDGEDIILENSGSYDVIKFSDELLKNFEFSGSGNDLIIKNKITGDKITIRECFNGSIIESFVFSDVTLNYNSVQEFRK